jgi:hypothetical protein
MTVSAAKGGLVMAAQRLVGLILVLLGLLLLVVLRTEVGGEAIPLFIGVGFLIAYAATRQYGFLVPGGVLTGLGAGVVVAAADGAGTAPVLGLGLGFLGIAVVDRLVRGSAPGFWWPVIPGGILTVVGLATMRATQPLMRYIVPGLLVVVGLALVLSRGTQREQRHRESRDAPV